MRIRLSDEIRQVIQLYQQYFPPTSDDDAAAASVDEAQALSAALALDKKDITQDNFIEKVKGIFYEYTELSKIQYLRDHDQLLTGKTYRDATFLQRILNTCSEYQRAQENKQWVAEGTLMTYHGLDLF